LKRFVSIMFAVAVFAAGVIPSFSQTPVKPAAAAPAKPTVKAAPPKIDAPAPKPAPSPDTLASGSYIVYGQDTQVLRVVYDAKKMRNLSVTGHFAVTDAGENGTKELEVFVFDEDNYAKFKNEKPAEKADSSKAADTAAAKPAAEGPPKAIYSSGRKASGELNVAITNPGFYFVVFSNKFATAGKKTFDVDVHLKYDKIP
jgi:hypothetical protein